MSAPHAQIPTSTTVVESAVIRSSLAQVWALVGKLSNFSQFWSALSSSDLVQSESAETDVCRWVFKDGNALSVKQDEYSNIHHYITYSVISSAPELSYSMAVNTIRCYTITCGEMAGNTFVEWSVKFSSDADAGVIQDARFKRQEALADLNKAAKAN